MGNSVVIPLTVVIALTTTFAGCNSRWEEKMRSCKSCVCTKCWNNDAAGWKSKWCKDQYCPKNCPDQEEFDTIWKSFDTRVKAGRGDQECKAIRWHLRMPDRLDGNEPRVDGQGTEEGQGENPGAKTIQRNDFNAQTLRQNDDQHGVKPSGFLETNLRESVPKLHGGPGTQKSEIVETHLRESALKPHSTGNEDGA